MEHFLPVCSMPRHARQSLMCEPTEESLSSPYWVGNRAVFQLGQRRHGDRQVIINQLKAHYRQPAPRIVAGDHAVRHTDPAGSTQPTTQRPPHHGLCFSDVGYQVHPALTPRANGPEIDGHHQLAEQILIDVDFIGTAVLGLWRDRLQFDREHRCCASAVVANEPCLSQGARSRQPRWPVRMDTAADVPILDGLECRIISAQRLELHEAVDDLS
jgi:hypothetical protein